MVIAPEQAGQMLTRRRADLEAKLSDPATSERSKVYAKRVELPCVAAAFARIKDGTYGVCIACGEAIEPRRLVAIPEVPICKACEKPEQKV